MTNGLGIAAVSAALRNMLQGAVTRHKLEELLDVDINVSALPPDRVRPPSGAESSQLNLFLYRVSPNCGWSNLNLPTRDGSGQHRLNRMPLPLNLHFLLTAYCAADLHAEVLLGVAMQWLHTRPVLSRESLRKALVPSSTPVTALEEALEATGLADQVELVKITPEILDSEEMSKLWAAVQSNLRPSAAYKATVVLIDPDEPASSPLPVLTRGQAIPDTERDEGVVVRPGLALALPTVESVEIAEGQTVAQLGKDVDLLGHNLAGADRTVLLANDRFAVKQQLSAAGDSDDGRMSFSLPSGAAADFPVGVYSVGARVVREGEASPRESNRLALTVAPEITGLPATVARDPAETLILSINFTPELRPGQQAVLVLGEQEYEPDIYEPPVAALTFTIKNAKPAPAPGVLARLRIDGVESPVIDRSVNPPTFQDKRIIIT